MTGEQAAPVITEEEVQALLDRAGPGGASPAGVQPFDLAGGQRITRGRLPTLELLHETFARLFRAGVSELVKREVQVTFQGVQLQKAADYLSALPLPACLEIARARPLVGQFLFAIDPQLVFLMVDAFYGGPGRAVPRAPDRGLTPTENRFARMVVKQASADLAQAWQPVAALDFELVKQERNAHFVDICAPGDTVLVNRFHVELPNGSGPFDFVLPAAAVEPMREILASSSAVRPPTGSGTWLRAFGAGVLDGQVEVRAVLAEASISLGELVRLKPGDMIPIDAPREATILAGDVPLYTARFGVSRGRNALTIHAAVPPPRGRG